MARYLAVDYDRERFCIVPSQISDVEDIITVDHRPRSTLSGGAIAGIVVGSVAVLLAAIVLVLVLLKKRRKRKAETLERGDAHSVPNVSEALPGPLRDYYAPDGKREMDGIDPASELPSPDPNKQMSPVLGAAEIDSDYPPHAHRRTLSGDTLPMGSIVSQELETVPSRESQQSPGLLIQSQLELEGRRVYEMPTHARSYRSVGNS